VVDGLVLLACIGWSWCGGTGGRRLRAPRLLERSPSASASQNRFCGPRDPSIHQLSAGESQMQPKVSELLTIDLYGTLTTVRSDFAMIRSDFNLPLKLIPTVVGGAY
jgi:hypothetical protein